MYLLDTNVISEIRKKNKANPGVRSFFRSAIENQVRLALSVITIGELRRGVELIRHRGDPQQADHLEKWLNMILVDYKNNILDIDEDTAQLWGKLRSPHPQPQHAIDKLIAATALAYDLTVVTRNSKEFLQTGVRVIDPFE